MWGNDGAGWGGERIHAFLTPPTNAKCVCLVGVCVCERVCALICKPAPLCLQPPSASAHASCKWRSCKLCSCVCVCCVCVGVCACLWSNFLTNFLYKFLACRWGRACIYMHTRTRRHSLVCVWVSAYIATHSFTSGVQMYVYVCASCDFLQVQVVLFLFSFPISPTPSHSPAAYQTFSISTDSIFTFFLALMLISLRGVSNSPPKREL